MLFTNNVIHLIYSDKSKLECSELYIIVCSYINESIYLGSKLQSSLLPFLNKGIV